MTTIALFSLIAALCEHSLLALVTGFISGPKELAFNTQHCASSTDATRMSPLCHSRRQQAVTAYLQWAGTMATYRYGVYMIKASSLRSNNHVR